MSNLDALRHAILTEGVRHLCERHMMRIQQAQDPVAVYLALARAEGLIEGLSVESSLSPATIELLSIIFDDAVTRRLEILDL